MIFCYVPNHQVISLVVTLCLPYKTWWKPRFQMDQRPLVKGCIANFGISLDNFEFLRFGLFFPFFKKIGFWGILGPPGNHASRWIRDLWSKGVLLILAYFQTFLSFYVLDDFFRFSKKSGFWVFLVHPPMALVILSASVERCFVSRMRDFQVPGCIR